MWPFKPRRDTALEVVTVMGRILEHQAAENRRLMESLAESQTRTLEAAMAPIKAHLAMFQVTEPPEARITRDSDEYQQELLRVGATDGFPKNEPPIKQLEFVHQELTTESLAEELGF